MVARNKLVIRGTLGASSEEQWSVGIHYRDPGGGAVLDATTLGQWATNVFQNMSVTLGVDLENIMGPQARIVGIDTYGYGPTGPAVAQGQATGTPIVGTGASVRLPPQCALVATLETGLAGRSFRGRIYWPALGMTVGTNLKATIPSGTASGFATLLQQCGDVGGGAAFLEPVVYSATRNVVTPVTSVSVGDIIDSQRSRRNNLIETRSSALV